MVSALRPLIPTAALAQTARSVALSLTLMLGALPALAQTTSPELEQQVIEIIKRNPQVILDAVRTYQRRAQWQDALNKRVTVDLKNAPVLGPAEAALTLVEFSDFQCPFCVRARLTVRELMDKYKGKIRLAYVHLPLPIHDQAKPAALAAWAAGRQGKFFEYHDRLFDLMEKITPESFEVIAKDLGLDLAKFNLDRKGPQALAQIEADEKQAQALGLDGTPTFVLNGVVLRGALPLSDFEEVIQLLQSKPAAEAKKSE
ncbi:DsbA family protein [Anthocerotibacter panamensis]|uniref:DsbA family protein n=1 Tax=Anthocerotibacter panamensis TaxID=2857077 RepID=UPI001C4030B8|nr:thioredoxin domain-containing protein [Anthocerotibacter panamensis]